MTSTLVNAYHDRKRDRVVLVGRRGDRLVTREVPAEHSCFLLAAEADKSLLNKLASSCYVRSVEHEGRWVRVGWVDRGACYDGSRWLQDSAKIRTFEAAVSPVRRWILDHLPRILRPRSIYLDIETDSRVPFSRKEDARILCWSLVRPDETTLAEGMLDEDTDGDERRLLLELLEKLEEYDQVLAWNGDRFDFSVIRARTSRARISTDLDRWLWLDHLKLFKRQNMMAAESGEEKASYALDSIARAVLGEGQGKLEFDAANTYAEWLAGGERRRRLGAYCTRDTNRMPAIERKTGYVELLATLCEACNVFADSRGMLPALQVEGFLLDVCRQRDFKFASRLDRGGGERFKGAFVMEPTERGILRDVHVCDFASLYPSIIRTWNMSPETRLDEPDEGGSYCRSPKTGVCFDTTTEGVLPHAVAELIRLRKHWNDKKASLPPGSDAWHEANRRSTAYKIAANSFYGVIGNDSSLFYDRRVAESVTQAGVWLLEQTIRFAQRCDMDAAYGDTDSAFIYGCSKEKFSQFVDFCNSRLYPKILARLGVDADASTIKLAYEKQFRKLIFPLGKKGSPVAKRYAGSYAHFKGTAPVPGDPKAIEVKGLEYKRGDSSRFERTMQFEVVQKLLIEDCEDPREFEDLVLSWRRHILDEPLELDDVMISKSLSKPLSSYASKLKKDGTRAARPPHVEVGLLLRERGQDVGEGTRVGYVVVDGSSSPKKVIPAEDWEGECDRYELWERIVWPASMRLLAGAFPAEDWSRFTKVRPSKRHNPNQLRLFETAS